MEWYWRWKSAVVGVGGNLSQCHFAYLSHVDRSGITPGSPRLEVGFMTLQWTSLLFIVYDNRMLSRKYECSADGGGRAVYCGSTVARLLGLRVRKPPGGMDVSLEIVVCCQVDVCASGWSPVQRSPTECDSEPSIMRRPWPTRGVAAPWKKKNVF